MATLLAQPLQLYFGLRGSELLERSVYWLERVRLGAHYLDRLAGWPPMSPSSAPGATAWQRSA